MKIAFLLTQSLESPGGLGRYWPMARELARLGHQVEIQALHPDMDALQQAHFEQSGVQVHYVAPMHVRKRANLKTYYTGWQLLGVAARATRSLTRAALQSDAEIIHVGKPHPMNGLAGLLASRLRGKKLFVDCDDYEAASGRFGAGWQKQGVAFFERWLPRLARRVTTNTSFLHAKLVAWGVPEQRITYLPNGVERERFAPPDPDQIAALRTKLELEGKQVAAFVGSLSLPSHPVDLLLEAFHDVVRANPQAVLLIVGGGEDYDHLQKQTHDLGLDAFVRFCGRVAPHRVPLYYHLAQVSVDPVHNNPVAHGRLPMKLFESWACGVPFVSAEVGDRRAIIGQPAAGLLVRPGDPAALGQAILQVLQNPHLAASLRRRGLERIEPFYWDQLVRRLEQAYNE